MYTFYDNLCVSITTKITPVKLIVCILTLTYNFVGSTDTVIIRKSYLLLVVTHYLVRTHVTQRAVRDKFHTNWVNDNERLLYYANHDYNY